MITELTIYSPGINFVEIAHFVERQISGPTKEFVERISILHGSPDEIMIHFRSGTTKSYRGFPYIRTDTPNEK